MDRPAAIVPYGRGIHSSGAGIFDLIGGWTIGSSRAAAWQCPGPCETTHMPSLPEADQ